MHRPCPPEAYIPVEVMFNKQAVQYCVTKYHRIKLRVQTEHRRVTPLLNRETKVAKGDEESFSGMIMHDFHTEG